MRGRLAAPLFLSKYQRNLCKEVKFMGETQQLSTKAIERKKKWHLRKKYIVKNKVLYLFVLPAVIYLILFNYLPMYGVQIAFRDYSAREGILHSPWVGLKHFRTFFDSYQFTDLVKNTLALSLYSLVAGFPISIIFALFLNYIGSPGFKKSAQMITYAPHFISNVVFCGMLIIFLSSDGVVSQIIQLFGGEAKNFIATPEYFRHIYVWSGVLKSTGWNSIMYISVLASVPPDLHEAAIVDGASKFKRMIYIDLPMLLPTATILLILNVGSIMNVGFEKAFLLQNSLNLDYSEIISTYVYKVGIQGGQFSYSAAIGLFNNVINFVLLILVNKFSKYLTGTSLW